MEPAQGLLQRFLVCTVHRIHLSRGLWPRRSQTRQGEAIGVKGGVWIRLHGTQRSKTPMRCRRCSSFSHHGGAPCPRAASLLFQHSVALRIKARLASGKKKLKQNFPDDAQIGTIGPSPSLAYVACRSSFCKVGEADGGIDGDIVPNPTALSTRGHVVSLPTRRINSNLCTLRKCHVCTHVGVRTQQSAPTTSWLKFPQFRF